MKPSWIKSRVPAGFGMETKRTLQNHGLNTVCVEAKCPNRGECWGCGTATFMVLGSVCTRNCGFCSVKTGVSGEAVSAGEPARLAKAVRELGLSYVVLTSVDRDDLADFGAGHYVECVNALKDLGGVRVEALTPDFGGDESLVGLVASSGLDVFAHNIETVERLSPKVRDARAGYGKSLKVLESAKDARVLTKSSILLGLGEEEDEVISAMEDLVCAGVDILVLGQYLQPTKKQLEVRRYWSPEDFERLGDAGLELGFKSVVASPMARTSFKAKQVFEDLKSGAL